MTSLTHICAILVCSGKPRSGLQGHQQVRAQKCHKNPGGAGKRAPPCTVGYVEPSQVAPDAPDRVEVPQGLEGPDPIRCVFDRVPGLTSSLPCPTLRSMKSQRRRSGIGLPEVLVGLLGLLQVAGESCHVLRTRAAFLGVPVARRCSPSVGTRGTSVGPHVVLGPAKKAGAADGEAKKPATRKKSASAASGEAAAPKKATTSRKKAASTEPAAAAEPAAEAPKPRKRKTAASSPAAPAPVEARPPAPPVAAPVEALAPAPPATPNALYDTRLVGRGQALNTFAGDQTFNVIKGSEDVVAPWSVDGFEVELPDWRPQPSQRYEITDPDMDDKLAKVYHMFGAQVRLVSTYDGIFRFFYFGEVRNLIGAEAWTKIIITEDLGIKECKQVRFETSYVRDWPDDYN